MNKKGFAPIIILLSVVGILVVGGAWYYIARFAPFSTQMVSIQNVPNLMVPIAPASKPTIYSTILLPTSTCVNVFGWKDAWDALTKTTSTIAEKFFYPCSIPSTVDAAHFSILIPWSWARDGKQVFFLSDEARSPANISSINGVDMNSFTVFDNNYAKDKNYVFYRGTVLKNADASTFTSLGGGLSGYYKDKDNIYLNGAAAITTQKIDTPTFAWIKGIYFKDKNNVYLSNDGGWDKLSGADSGTFQILDACMGVEKSTSFFAKDKNYVYCGAGIIKGADPATFEYVGSYDDNPGGMPMVSGVGKDKNCVYRRNETVLNSAGKCVDPAGCTANSIASNPLSCGITGGWGEFR